MARRKPSTGANISLFPFLSILACLSGAVLVMISILSILQTTQAGQRATVKNPMVRQYMELQQQLKADNARIEELTVLIERNESRQEELRSLDRRIIKLRKLLEGADASENISRELQKQLELLVIQFEELQRDRPRVEADIAALRAEIAERQKKPEDQAPALRVQPSGSGFARGRRLYVVEAAKDAVIVHRGAKDKLRIAASTVGADKEYDTYLEKVAADKAALLLFLVRSDGYASYERGAGWAEARFQIPTSKMPIPGKGLVDLSMFEEFMK